MIIGEKDSGKTGICAELIGIRKKFYNRYPRKFKNKIVGVIINNKNCLIVSEGDNEECIKNVHGHYLREAKKDLEKSNDSKKTSNDIDYLIITVRSKSPDLVDFAKTEFIKDDPNPIEIKTKKATQENFSISNEFYNKAQDVYAKII